MKNPLAVALGRMARGIKKQLTPEQRQIQRERLAAVRALRWKKNQTKEGKKP